MRSEADLAWESIFFNILANFFQFLGDFSGFWEPLGRLMGSIFGVFWGSKKGTNFEMIFETIFSDSQGWAVTPAVACLRPKRPLGMPLGYGIGKERGIQHALAQRAGGLSRQSRSHRPPI